jgi:uncharacterized protein (DUF305 family)
MLLASTAAPADSPIIQPGAPGEPPRELSADEAIAIANTSYSPADAQFMQDMIPHHHQALQMAELAAEDRARVRALILELSRSDPKDPLIQEAKQRVADGVQ